VLLDFWATWCPPCRFSVPELKKLHRDYAGKEFELVSVSLDEDVDAVKRMSAQEQFQHPVVMADAVISQNYSIRGIPKFVLVDRDGNVVRIWNGYMDTMSTEWRMEIDRLLKK
jgi:thiol-disulfide isomerase/thioredoxin